MTSVRLAAAQSLIALDLGRTTLAAELDRVRGALSDDRDRGLLVELATGTLRWRSELDAVIAAASARAIDSIDPPARAILRLGAYQLMHLDRVPAHAVVDQAVENARDLGHHRVAGFINAVLRAISRGKGREALPARPATTDGADRWIAYLSTSLSHPAWLVERWIGRHGAEAAEAWCRFNNASPTVTVRSVAGQSVTDLLERLRASDVGANAAPTVRDAIVLPPGALGRLPSDIRAMLVVQDEGSQLVAHTVDAVPGASFLDVCAAPGGKSIVVSSDMSGSGLMVAADRRASRVKLLRSMLDRAGVKSQLVALDATAGVPFDRAFDRVLVDVPCSGLGTIRRDPDLKWSLTADDLPRLAATQLSILSHAAEAVRPDGRLIYATCSSEPEENDEVVARFLALNSRFALVPATPGPHVHDSNHLVSPEGYLRTLPFRDALDAFFAAVLVRSSAP